MGNRDRLLNSLLNELADRLAASDADHVLVRREHLAGASDDLLAVLCYSSLLTAAEPASDTICDGCERLCPMPVETMQGAGAAGTSTFVVCDKRDDIGRVPVEPAQLRQWRFSLAKLAAVLADRMQAEQRPREAGDGHVWSLGATDIGGQRVDVALCAHPSDAPQGTGIAVTLAESPAAPGRPAICLDRLLTFRDGRLDLDQTALEAALAGRRVDDRVACEITYEHREIMLVNRATGVRRRLARPRFNSNNDLGFQMLFANANRPYTLGELQAATRANIRDLHKMVENLKFTGLLKTAFFSVSKNRISFRRQVTFDQLVELGIDPNTIA